ncbi:MAG: IS66-like element accessory protein TnpA [Steroidobacteraceae bacterium]
MRRQWSEEQRRQIVQESLGSGTVQVCRRHGLHPSLLTKWRAQQRGGTRGVGRSAGGTAILLPVSVQRTAGEQRHAPAAAANESGSRTGAIEVELASGGRLCIRGVVDVGMLRTVLEEMSRS